MVLGLRAKHRKGAAVQVDYIVLVEEIKPWPPLPSLGSIQSLLLKWENGNQNCGSLTASFEDSKIEISEPFTLPLTLCREKRAPEKFQKNFLEFSLYEPRRDKAAKGQLLGTAVINLADYGILEETLAVSAPISCKKSSKYAEQPVLFLKLQPVDKDSSNSSPAVNLSKEASLENVREESVCGLMNESSDDETEIAFFTDDDVSSHSSQIIASCSFESLGASPSQSEKDRLESAKQSTKMEIRKPALPLRTGLEAAIPEVTPRVGTFKQPVSSQILSSADLRLDLGNPTNGESRKCLNSSGHSSENEFVGKLSEDATRKKVTSRSDTLASRRKPLEFQGSTITNGKLKHVKSVQLSHDAVKHDGFSGNGHNIKKAKDIDHLGDSLDNVRSNIQNEIKESRCDFPDGKSEWKSRIEMLEEELREAAAVEVGLYSIVAEHGSSKNKVHAPARRLSRFYLHACMSRSQASRARAARAAVSGLVLISKACGNDVPRLTFWLSNSIMLRAIVSQAVAEVLPSDGPCVRNNSGGKGFDGRLPRKWNDPSSIGEEKSNPQEESDEWEDPETFIIALEKVEEWIFSRIVESIWWQTLTPHMQSAPTKTRSSGSRKTYGNKHLFAVQEQGNFSVEHWKKAFKDSCERLCPIRVGGHECGCLPFLAKLVMEQLVARLDVAMFNAILRESAEEMPTNPVSDPISDPRVLPIPAGKSSFGAGAQLKNAIGGWSRWLTDLFGIEDNDSCEDDSGVGDMCLESHMSFKAFRLLNALSDLMMLPFEMLADTSTRKEVCPLFGAPLIKRVLNNFVPDEFFPDPIPEAVLAALGSEDSQETDGEYLASFPCIANPPVYSPPRAASLIGIIGDVGSQALQRNVSSVIKKSYTSDDELDALDSPLTSIIGDNFRSSSSVKIPNWIPMGNHGQNIIRYQLLREVWRDGEGRLKGEE